MILPFPFGPPSTPVPTIWGLQHLLCETLDGGEHILHKDAVAARGVIDEHVGNSADDLAVPDQRRARQVCGQERTTNFVIFSIKFFAASSSSSVGNLPGKVFAIFNASYFEPA